MDSSKSYSLGDVNVEELISDSDIRRVARERLPSALEQMGKDTAEMMWKSLGKSSKGSGLQLSTSEKKKFIRDVVERFKREKAADVETYLVEQLREMRAEYERKRSS